MRVSDKMITEAVSNLQARMQELGLLEENVTLRLQLPNNTYGNSGWVALTGGDYYGSGVSIIDELHVPHSATRAQFLAVIRAYSGALFAVQRGAVK